jgi:hypothetical protein
MSSLWLCVDPEPAQRLHRPKCAQRSHSGPAFYGVFADEPMNISKRLPRPRTPFVPAPTSSFFGKPELVAGGPDVACEPPPAHAGPEMTEPHFLTLPSGIDIF